MIKHRGCSERGSSLVIALVMVLIVAVGIVALLGFADASFRAVDSVRTQRRNSYAAENAVQAAVQKLRGNDALGTASGPCPSPFISYPAEDRQPPVEVGCDVIQARGAGVPGDSWPQYAILATGASSAEAGITTAKSGEVYVGGPVASNSPAVAPTYSIDGDQLIARGYSVQAKGACSTGIAVDAPADLQCGTGAEYPDPAYPAQPFDIALLANPNPAPVCEPGQQAWRFNPGYYTDTRVFSPSGGGCNGNALWFSPGVYYFDFGAGGVNNGEDLWTVGKTVVGGEKKVANWTGTNGSGVPNANAAATGFSRWCKTELDGADSGVQWILGGSSQITIPASGGTIELCADPTPVGTKQQISIYGQKVDIAGLPPTGSNGSMPLYPTQISGAPTLFPAPTTNLLPIAPSPSAIDGMTKDSSPAIASGSTARVTFDGFNNASVPVGSLVSVVKVRSLQYIRTNPNRVDRITATINVGGTDVCTVDLPKRAVPNPGQVVTPDETVCPAPFALNGPVRVTYAATRANGGNSSQDPVVTVDGLELVVDYVQTPGTPGMRMQSGCVTQINGCSMLDVKKNNSTFVTWGTAYAPLAKIGLSFNNKSVFEFRRGVIARAVENVAVPPSETTNAFCLGYGTHCGGPLRVVKFTARIGGVVKVVAVVRFIDAPTLGFSAQTLSWNVSQ